MSAKPPAITPYYNKPARKKAPFSLTVGQEAFLFFTGIGLLCYVLLTVMFWLLESSVEDNYTLVGLLKSQWKIITSLRIW